MNERRFFDPGSYLAVQVWLCAALVFPLHLGIKGASVLSLLAYLGMAGALLTLAHAIQEPDIRGDWQVAVFEWISRVLSLAVPAALAFALGGLLTPVQSAGFHGDCPGPMASAAFEGESEGGEIRCRG